MLLPRTLSLALRAAQFLVSTILLSLTASFLHQRARFNTDDRLIYTLVVAALSLVLSVIWMLPTTNAIVHFGVDLFMAAAWFGVFGVLMSWDMGMGCGEGEREGWEWERMKFWGDACALWNAAQAFAFVAGVLWFVSFVLGLMVWAKRDRAAAVAAEGEAAPVPAMVGRRRWFGKSRG